MHCLETLIHLRVHILTSVSIAEVIMSEKASQVAGWSFIRLGCWQSPEAHGPECGRQQAW